jgi:hypothetical protein
MYEGQKEMKLCRVTGAHEVVCHTKGAGLYCVVKDNSEGILFFISISEE